MTPTAELLTRVFSLLEQAQCQLGCGCGGPFSMCIECEQLRYDIDGLLDNETQGDRP